MTGKITFANKILFIVIIFTLLLLSMIILIFYYGGKQYIENEGVKTVEVYSNLIDISLQEEISNSYIELEGLLGQIKNTIIYKGVDPEHLRRKNIRDFLISYPYKYSSLLFEYPATKKLFSATPVKVFSGEIKVDFNTIEYKYLNSKVYDYMNLNSNINNVTFVPANNFTNQFLYVLVRSQKKLDVLASVRYDYLFNNFINRIALSKNVSLTFLDSNGSIIYSTEKNIINQSIATGLPALSKYFDKFSTGGESQNFSLMNEVGRFKKMKELGLILLLRNNLTNQIKVLNKLIGYAVLISILMFILVTIMMKIFTRQLGISLNRITDVAVKVGRGDFEQRIEIKRGDEIGLLINTFNKMIEKLKINYEALGITNKKLEQKIKELIETKNELSKKEKLAIIGETVSKISHEIQNKISGISIWIQNLEYQLQGNETSKLYIDEIKIALNSFLEMLMNFKKFYRTPILEPEGFDINDLIKKILTDYSTEIDSKRIEIKLKLQPQLPKLVADKKQIEEALINLLINALYYTPEGKPVEILTAVENGFIKIRFVDYGPGLNLEMKEKIFQPFFTTKAEGSGLGLAIVHNIVIAHKGKINVCNKEKAGACFEIFLPLEKMQ